MAYFLGLARKEEELMNQWQLEVRSGTTYFNEYLEAMTYLSFHFFKHPKAIR